MSNIEICPKFGTALINYLRNNNLILVSDFLLDGLFRLILPRCTPNFDSAKNQIHEFRTFRICILPFLSNNSLIDFISQNSCALLLSELFDHLFAVSLNTHPLENMKNTLISPLMLEAGGFYIKNRKSSSHSNKLQIFLLPFFTSSTFHHT